MAKPPSTAIVIGCLAAAALVGPARAEPRPLGGAQLDGVTAAGTAGPPGWGPPVTLGFEAGATPDRSTQISTRISIPVSTAVAICTMCSGDASAVAQANAVGMAQAAALAMTTGRGSTLATSNSVGPYPVVLVPTAPRPGAGRGGR
jgi:hypothetical protein